MSDGTLASRVARGRARYFVGRDHELRYWQQFSQPQHGQPLWFIHGPGGMGKTLLLHMLQASGGAGRRTPAFIDAAFIAAEPPLVQAVIERALAASCPVEGTPATIVLIDSFEYWQALEGWFRQIFLPAQPATLKIVFAGRQPPSQHWRLDSGWRALLRVTALPLLSAHECTTYLWRRQLPITTHQPIVTLSTGHPLALALATDAALAGHTVPDSIEQADETLYQPLFDSFTREAVRADQRLALDAAAVARELNASLLTHMLAVADANDLFVWLARLTCMQSHDHGLAPMALVRGTLLRAMLDRAPQRYQRLASNATAWVIEHLETSQALNQDASATLAEQAMFALRGAALVQYYITPSAADGSQQRLYLDCWRSGDEHSIHPMIACHEGADSLHWFRFWQARQGSHVSVVRDAGHRPVAVLLRLDMEALAADARASDPLTQALWQALQTQFNIHPGDHMPFIRHWVTHDYAASHSPPKTRLLMAIHAHNIMAKNLRLSAQVFDDVQAWDGAAAMLGMQALSGSDIKIGTRSWRIYYNDWALEPPAHYYRRFAARVFDADMVLRSGAPEADSGGPITNLDEIGFTHAAIAALKQLHKPRELGDNPLLHSALVNAHIDAAADVAARSAGLGRCLQQAIAAVHDNGELGQRQARVLQAAFIDHAGNQKTAAAALHMGYSTFRRHLRTACRVLIAELWAQEQILRRTLLPTIERPDSE